MRECDVPEYDLETLTMRRAMLTVSSYEDDIRQFKLFNTKLF
jgi:hypothetical protein